MKRKNKHFIFQSKKGNGFLDLMIVIVILLGFGICSIIGYRVFQDLNNDIQADTSLNTEAKNLSNNLYIKYPSLFDSLFLFLVVLLWIFIIVSSAVIDTHPMFFVVTLILLIFGFIISMELSNVFEEWTTEDDINSVISEFPFTYYFLTHLFTVAIIFGSTILITLYGKNKFMGG